MFKTNFKQFTFFRKHKMKVKKAMRYISNRTSCVTFLPATSSSPNFVTIAPGPKSFMEYLSRVLRKFQNIGQNLGYFPPKIANIRCVDPFD